MRASIRAKFVDFGCGNREIWLCSTAISTETATATPGGNACPPQFFIESCHVDAFQVSTVTFLHVKYGLDLCFAQMRVPERT